MQGSSDSSMLTFATRSSTGISSSTLGLLLHQRRILKPAFPSNSMSSSRASTASSSVSSDVMTSSMYICKSMIAAARGQTSLLSSACCRTTYWARYGEARSPNISLIASYTSGGLVRSNPLHKKRWYRRSFFAIITWENISVRSATRATGFLRKRSSTSKMSCCSFGPGNMVSLRLIPPYLAAES